MARGTTTLSFVSPTPVAEAEPDGETEATAGTAGGGAARTTPAEGPEETPSPDAEPASPSTVAPGSVERGSVEGPTAPAPRSGAERRMVMVKPSPRPRPRPDGDTAAAESPPAESPRAESKPEAASAPASPRPAPETPAVDVAEAEEFVRHFHRENPGAGPVEARLDAVRDEIARTGTYVHTHDELEFGARVAWRNSARCIGRLYWRSLHLRDRRDVSEPDAVAAECVGHLRESTRRGRVRSTITVFAPDVPGSPGPRIWNDQLVRYAGYRAGGSVMGDPQYTGFTDTARSLGWMPPSPMGHFDVLPLVITGGGEHAAAGPRMTEVPADAVMEVPLSHPDHEWFAELGLRWHVVPAISNMHLDIGGVTYPAAPFNGWYMATEIGARNLADPERYDLLGEVAHGMGLDTTTERTMWRDRAAVELTLAVQHSFDTAGVTLADHHGESQRFLRHVQREEAAGRSCPVDWSWIVPPISGGLTPVFHRYYDEPTDSGPMFRLDDTAKARGRGCPV